MYSHFSDLKEERKLAEVVEKRWPAKWKVNRKKSRDGNSPGRGWTAMVHAAKRSS